MLSACSFELHVLLNIISSRPLKRHLKLPFDATIRCCTDQALMQQNHPFELCVWRRIAWNAEEVGTAAAATALLDLADLLASGEGHAGSQ